MFMAFAFCTTNGYIQARYLCTLMVYNEEWITDPRFVIGLMIWGHGFYLNNQADTILRNLRKPGDKERYKIPRGGLFELVSGANFAGEIWEWFGFAVASWSFGAATFALFTFLNTAPRGVAHHKWYLAKFKDYPANRRGVLPYLW
jgi:steroid 5-alpha reductase family enzyme